MSDGYVLENGEIKINLSDADLEDILDDVKDCRVLLEPQIRLVGNTVIFRDQDIKLIDPVTFFVKKPPMYQLAKKHKVQGVILCALLMIYFGFLSIGHSPLIILFNLIMGVLFGFITIGAIYSHLNSIEIRRHRKALYVKAKLLSFFYMVVLQELTTTNERLERISNRQQGDHSELKSMYRRVFLSLPNDIRLSVPNRFPDGEEIHPENRNYS